MIEFESKMASDIKGMIELKAATHFNASTYTDRAKAFDQFCKEHFPEDDVITKSITLCWIKDSLDHHSRNTVHSGIAFIRTLSSYQKALGKNPYVPPVNMLNANNLFVPYIFTNDELKDLFYQIDISEKGSVFERILFSTYFRLAYTCGLRPFEVRTLKRSNVDLNSGEIRIINSKWNRSRTIVMSDDMQKLAKKYANSRDLKYPECEWFFPSHTGGCYTASQIQNRFKKFYELSNPDIPKDLLPRVRVYDLRHRFATASLSVWLDKKMDINARLPYLQTYMGHKNTAATAYYIHLLPENLTKSAGIDWETLNAVIPEVESWEE